MPMISVYNQDGERVSERELSDLVFDVPVNIPLIHQVVVAQLENRRQGNASTKVRHDVRGGGAKPWRQKGTGNARQGSRRAAQWRGGGIVHGPRPHRYHHDTPRKMRRQALCGVLTNKVQEEKLIIVESLLLETPRTKDMLALLAGLPIQGFVLILLDERDDNIYLSSRNIEGVKIGSTSSLNIIDIMKYDTLLMSVNALDAVEQLLSAPLGGARRQAAYERTRLSLEAALTELDSQLAILESEIDTDLDGESANGDTPSAEEAE